MTVAYVQEFVIVDGDRSTANYDAVVAASASTWCRQVALSTRRFDTEKGVFRIFDVWESRESGREVDGDVLTRSSSGSWRGLRILRARPSVSRLRYDLHDSMS